ncbi:MAG: hypothetical protein N3C12_09520 [Candidatus Binatia bacterium]|nr:hypothetical protein [Candidatus Binatia bacterium]
MFLLRSTTFWVGVALLLLGAGNWVIGQNKVADHRRLLRTAESQVLITPPEGFEQLTARTNLSLLKPFRVSAGRMSALEQKLQFYRVVESGGRILCAIGALSALAGFLHARRLAGRHTQVPAGSASISATAH